MQFYEKLRTLRKRSGMSQEELAGQLDVSRQAVSKWESGQGYPETDKLLRLSTLFGVSLDYLLKDEGDEEPPGGGPGPAQEAEAGFYVSREVAQGYLVEKRRGAQRIALGVGVLILAVALFTLMEGVGEAISLAIFFCVIALGVGILVWQGFQPNHYRHLEEQPLYFDAAVLAELKAQSMEDRRRSGAMLLCGLALCILSFAAMFLLNAYTALPEGASTAVCFGLIALGVALLIMAGSFMQAHDVLTQNRKHRKEAASESRHGWIFALVMPLTAFVFVGLGLAFHVWHIAWVLFPIAAISCTAYVNYKESREK